MYNILIQLGIKNEPEYSPDWAGLLKYDNYLTDYNIIIENHGLQHYAECGLTTRTLQEEKDNDLKKYNLARDNGINNYIIIDCRRPTMEWIQQSIMQSDLPKIFHFSEQDINWIEALKYATHSLVKVSAQMFNEGRSITEIANKLQKHVGTIRTWLKRATSIGWCTYVPRKAQDVYCIELNQLFCISKAANETHTSVASIINNLRGIYKYAGRHPQTNKPLHWLSVEEAMNRNYITLQND